ncbi:hypothetical protein [Beijerinckia sp. L45]|uniref:hypothetical protein n=1 Tax=Beijerinckia sp. L45 TaxID=1641855 RepID=UPI00131E2C5C|nr:hypothetical protein [Beijerinckia sp. L45]
MALMRIGSACAGGVFGLALAWTAAAAQAPAKDGAAAAAPAVVAPADPAKDEPIIYIFSGTLTGDGETYSGTLVAAADGPQFELKLSKGATCDASKLEPDKGLLRLPETPCSDGRKLKALFVYQEGNVLRVYGTLGADRFSTQAHALPSDAPEAAAAKPVSPPADLMDRPK